MTESMLSFLKAIQGISSPALDTFFTLFNYLSQEYFLIFIVTLFYWLIDKKKGEYLAFSLIFTLSVTCGLKGVFCVKRPYTYEGINPRNKHTAPGFSFPSADSSCASSVATTLGTFTKKHLLKILLVLYVLMIGFSRMYFGLHFPTDVAGGILLGFIISLGSKKILDNINKPLIFYGVCTVLLLLFFPFSPQAEFFKTFGLMLGSFCGICIEKKFVNFNTDVSAVKKIIRLAMGISGIAAIAVITKTFLPENNFFHVFDKFCLTFFAVGIYPVIFKKFKF